MASNHIAGVHHKLIGLNVGKYNADSQRGIPGRLVAKFSLEAYLRRTSRYLLEKNHQGGLQPPSVNVMDLPYLEE